MIQGWSYQTFVFAVAPNDVMTPWQACYLITHINHTLRNTVVATIERDAVKVALSQRPN